MNSNWRYLYKGIFFAITAITFLPIKEACAASIFIDSSTFDNPTVIDFEPSGSGNSVSSINNYLNTLGTGATLSLGGAQARIDNLSDNERAIAFGVNTGADGDPVSGVWGFEGGVYGESFLTLTFAPGHFTEAVGIFWGGAVNSNARMVATFEDGSTFTAFLRDFLPLVPNSAVNGINGFLGIDGEGKLIQQVSFFNNNDLYSQDNVMFGSTGSSSSESVPEPSSILGFSVLAALALGSRLKRKGN